MEISTVCDTNYAHVSVHSDIEKIPNEMLGLIFSFVPLEHIPCCALVSRRFYSSAQDLLLQAEVLLKANLLVKQTLLKRGYSQEQHEKVAFLYLRQNEVPVFKRSIHRNRETYRKQVKPIYLLGKVWSTRNVEDISRFSRSHLLRTDLEIVYKIFLVYQQLRDLSCSSQVIESSILNILDNYLSWHKINQITRVHKGNGLFGSCMTEIEEVSLKYLEHDFPSDYFWNDIASAYHQLSDGFVSLVVEHLLIHDNFNMAIQWIGKAESPSWITYRKIHDYALGAVKNGSFIKQSIKIHSLINCIKDHRIRSDYIAELVFQLTYTRCNRTLNILYNFIDDILIVEYKEWVQQRIAHNLFLRGSIIRTFQTVSKIENRTSRWMHYLYYGVLATCLGSLAILLSIPCVQIVWRRGKLALS